MNTLAFGTYRFKFRRAGRAVVAADAGADAQEARPAKFTVQAVGFSFGGTSWSYELDRISMTWSECRFARLVEPGVEERVEVAVGQPLDELDELAR
jgi:hypothetical protein